MPAYQMQSTEHSNHSESFWSKGQKAAQLMKSRSFSSSQNDYQSKNYYGEASTGTEITAATSTVNDNSGGVGLSGVFPITRIYSTLSNAVSHHSNRTQQSARSRPTSRSRQQRYGSYDDSDDDENYGDNDNMFNTHERLHGYSEDDGVESDDGELSTYSKENPSTTIQKLRMSLEKSSAKNTAAKFNLSRNDELIISLRKELSQCKSALSKSQNFIEENKTLKQREVDLQTELDQVHANLITESMKIVNNEEHIKGLESALMEKQTYIEKMIRESESLKKNHSPRSVSQFPPTSSTGEDKVAGLELKISQLNIELKKLKSTNQALENQLTDQVVTQKDENEIDVSREELIEEIQSLKQRLFTSEENTNAEEKKEEQSVKVQKLQKEMHEKDKSMESLQTKIHHLHVAQHELQSELKTKESQLDSLEYSFKSAQSQLSDFQKKFRSQATLQDQLKERDDTIDELQEKIRSLSKPSDTSVNNMTLDETEIYREEIKSLQKSLDIMSERLKTSKSRSQEEIDDLKCSLEIAESKARSTKKEYQVMKDQLDSLRQKEKSKQNIPDSKESDSETETLKNQLSKAQSEIDELRNRLQNSSTQQKQTGDTTAQVTDLQNQLNEQAKSIKSKDKALKHLKKSLKESLQMLKPLQDLVQEHEVSKEELSEEVQKKTKEIEALEQKIQTLNENHAEKDLLHKDKFVKKLDPYITQMKDLEMELKTSEEYRKKMEREEGELREKFTNNQKELEEMTRSYTILSKTLQQVEDNFIQLKNQMSNESSTKNNALLQQIEEKKVQINSMMELFLKLDDMLEDDGGKKNNRHRRDQQSNLTMKDIESYRHTVQSLEIAFKDLNERVSFAQEEAQMLEGEMKVLKQSNSKQPGLQKLQKLEREFNVAKQKLQEKESNLTQLQKQLEDSQFDNIGLENQLEAAQQELRDKTDNSDDLAKLKSVQKELDVSLKERQSLAQELNHLRQIMERMERKEHGANYSKVMSDRDAIDLKMQQMNSSILSDIQNNTTESSDEQNSFALLLGKQDDSNSSFLKTSFIMSKKKLLQVEKENEELTSELKQMEEDLTDLTEEFDILRQSLSSKEKELENAKYIATCSIMKLEALTGVGATEEFVNLKSSTSAESESALDNIPLVKSNSSIASDFSEPPDLKINKNGKDSSSNTVTSTASSMFASESVSTTQSGMNVKHVSYFTGSTQSMRDRLNNLEEANKKMESDIKQKEEQLRTIGKGLRDDGRPPIVKAASSTSTLSTRRRKNPFMKRYMNQANNKFSPS